MLRVCLILMLASLGACQPSTAAVGGERPAAVNPDPGVRTYHCEDGTIVEAGYPDARSAVVKVGGRPYPLQTQPAASGVRYVGFGLQWWTRGMTEARLARLKDGETIASDTGVLCRAK